MDLIVVNSSHVDELNFNFTPEHLPENFSIQKWYEGSLKLYFKRFLCIIYTINYQRLRTSTLTKKRYFILKLPVDSLYKSPFSRSLLFLPLNSHGWKILPLTKLFLVNVFHPHLLLIFRM